MTFYQELQLNQAGSKLMIQEAVGRRAKAWHLLVYLVKILLTMVFCVAFVTLYGWVFGAENNIVGVVVLLCLMVIDYLSGMAASAVEALDHPDDKSYGWSSKKGAKGIAKKVAYLFVIAVGMVIDYVIIQTSGVLGFNLPNTMLSLLVTVWYMLNEALSITENAGRMGAPVPEWLMKYIAALKSKIDNNRENGDSTE